MSSRPPMLARLVEQARDPAGSLDDRHAAFASLVQRTQHLVFAIALTSLRDVEDAKDVAQDVFATVWRRLRQLRDPLAFDAWMNRIVASECARRRRQGAVPPRLTPAACVDADVHRVDYQDTIATALDRLPDGERQVTVLYYFLGYTLPQIARLLRLKPGTVGKRLHSARLRVRRWLPPSVRHDFVRLAITDAFADRVQRGLLDEYTGEYRFDRRPGHLVSITRVGNALVSESGGQRHVLVPGGEQKFRTYHYDGEGDFRRNRRGEITHFVYYEFGRRLGIARKVGARGDDGGRRTRRSAGATRSAQAGTASGD